jgi:hypothetical protein
MNNEIEKYNAFLAEDDRKICDRLRDEIEGNLIEAVAKIWHGSPVWFIEDNPVVGYTKLKSSIQLLFWSGASFEDNLIPVGKFRAAEARYTDVLQINAVDLARWLNKSRIIQWDYKNIVNRHGELERLR